MGHATLVLALGASLAGAASPGSVTTDVTGLRSAKGQILVCMTMRPDLFTKCDKDPAARKLAVPVAQARSIRFDSVPVGIYAIALVHDENGNNKMDTGFMGMPKEGFGFSRNPVIRFGPPKFAEVHFAVGAAEAAQPIRIKYML